MIIKVKTLVFCKKINEYGEVHVLFNGDDSACLSLAGNLAMREKAFLFRIILSEWCVSSLSRKQMISSGSFGIKIGQ